MHRFARSLAAAFAAVALASTAAAQQTHIVQLFALSFSPNDLVIQEGDTVRWVWVSGWHDVKSSKNWIPDGLFDSGNPTMAPASFEVRFDAAFLQANPMPKNVYQYICQLHTPAMVGKITVQSPAFHGGVLPYGTDLSAPGSLALLAGAPKLGGSFTIGARNTAITTAGPAAVAVYVSTGHWDWWPVGEVLPGFGLDGSSPGELLLDLSPPNPILVLGPDLWAGGTAPPVAYQLPVPNSPGLVGRAVYLQAGLFDLASGKIGLTNGLQVVFGI
jgi:plastocyanin